MRSLVKVVSHFTNICSKIDYSVAFALNLIKDNPVEANWLISYSVIKLHDQWNARCREIVIKSCQGGYRTKRGTLLSRSVKENPLDYLRNNWARTTVMGSNWEPDWHIPSNTIRAASLLNVQNLAEIQNALGAITVIDELRWTRNAMVHQLPHTFGQYRLISNNRSLSHITEPANLAIHRDVTSQKLIIDIWEEELTIALNAAIA